MSKAQRVNRDGDAEISKNAPITDDDVSRAILDRLDGLSRDMAELRAEVRALADEVSASRRILPGFLARPLDRVVRLARPRLFSFKHYPPRAIMTLEAVPPPVHAPKISIVTPAFRHGRFIEETIASVLSQGYANLQYVVQDGGSDDETVDILQRYDAQLAHWNSAPDKGQSDAINRGFAHCDGAIMAWLNSDDLLLPGALNSVAQFFNDNPDVDVVYGHRVIIDESSRQIGRWIMPEHDNDVLSWADYIPQETLFWRRSIWDKAGARIDDSFKFAMDWDLLIRFRDCGAKFARLPRPLGAFRVHAAQKTSANIDDVGAAEMERIRTRLHGSEPTPDRIRGALTIYMLRHLVAHYAYALNERYPKDGTRPRAVLP